LFSEYPSYPDLEIAKLTTSLKFMRDKLGADDALVNKVLQGKDPATRAAELIHGTKMASAAERQRIYKAGTETIASSTDPMIVLAREIDADSRALRSQYEAQVTEPQTEALTEINKARFALLGTSDYPDATGTLRLAFGVVKGYEQDGKTIPPWTTLGGAYSHEKEHGAKEPFLLPASWAGAKEKLDTNTPLNFVCTADIIGGNSGSPVVNRDGELVGVIFDSNRQGVVDGFSYSDTQARAVAVDSRGIIEALNKIYGAEELVKELTH
jgi:Peptidase S46